MAEPAAAGWMFVTLNDSGRSPCSAAFFSLWSAMRASVPPMPPSTRLPLFANDTLGSARLLSRLVNWAAVGTSGADAGSNGSGAPKTTGCIWYTTGPPAMIEVTPAAAAPIAAAAVRPAAIDFTIFMVVFFRSFARRLCVWFKLPVHAPGKSVS
ncbi:Uncharacterised protein [Mycobacterium tuberculosis]|nr:Uncharacterised protein [Mycobacterium tuberculosis]